MSDLHTNRILVIDDEEGLRLTFELILQRAGYRNVTGVGSFDEAIAAIEDGNEFACAVGRFVCVWQRLTVAWLGGSDQISRGELNAVEIQTQDRRVPIQLSTVTDGCVEDASIAIRPNPRQREVAIVALQPLDVHVGRLRVER